MTEVSRSAPPVPKTATTPTSANRGPAGKAPEERGDVFSALLSLVAETRDIQTPPADESLADGSGAQVDESAANTPNTTQDGSHNPLAQLLGWADPQAVADRTAPGAAERGLAASGNTTQTLHSGDGTGHDTTGMQPLTASQAIDPATVSTGAKTGVNITGMQPLATPQAIDAVAVPADTKTGVNITGVQPLTAPQAINAVAVPADTKTGINITGVQPNALPQAAEAAAVGSAPAGRFNGAVVLMPGAPDARTSSARRDAKASTAADSIANTTAGLRAPTTLWQPMTNASTRAAAPAGGSEALRAQGVGWGNSTVSMDLSTAREADGVADNAVSLTARLSAMLAGQAQTDGAAPAPLLGATPEAGASPAEGLPPADLLPRGEAVPEPEPTQISHWSTQHLRHAHLRLGDGALDSVDIRLSMQGQELSVDFRTDNADIRQSLAQQANQSLAVLLERSGIALADVSVGAQQQQQRQSAGQNGESQRDRTAQEGRSRAAARVQADASVAMHAPVAQALRADGSRPLDLFV